MNTVRILFDLRSGIGLGDAAQMGILFRHLRKYRPHWTVDVRCPSGFMACFVNCVNKVWASEPGLCVVGEYEQVIGLNWTDCFETFGDRPSTKVAYALKNMFGIEEYDASLGRYEIESQGYCRGYLPKNFVAIHTKGNSHPKLKNLTTKDFHQIAHTAKSLGRVPFDMNERSDCVGGLRATIYFADAFIGIDSGPGKVASATDTPTLICWTGHHPLRYHDPAPNTTHLLPEDHYNNEAFRNIRCEEESDKVCGYFEANYRFITYRPGELAQEACRWLRETLK